MGKQKPFDCVRELNLAKFREKKDRLMPRDQRNRAGRVGIAPIKRHQETGVGVAIQ
jgi:hypothetical protein